MDTTVIEKSKAHIVVEIIEYIPNSVVIKTILRKSTGNTSLNTFDSGEGVTEKSTPHDTFIQKIEEKAAIVIKGEPYFVESSQSVVTTAQASCFIKPNEQFKMNLTIIKGDDD